jgi:hypothetical protein
MWHLLAEGGTVGREHEAPPASVAHPDKRHVCISLATTVPLIFATYSSLHSDISRVATSKHKTVCPLYSDTLRIPSPCPSVCPQDALQLHTPYNRLQWRTQEFFWGGGGGNKFIWGQGTGRTGTWGRQPPSQGF